MSFLPRMIAEPKVRDNGTYDGKKPLLRTFTLPVEGQPEATAKLQIHDGVTLRALPSISRDRRDVHLRLDMRYEALNNAGGPDGNATSERFAMATLARTGMPDKATLLIWMPLEERKIIGVKQTFDPATGGNALSLVTETIVTDKAPARVLVLLVKPTIILPSGEDSYDRQRNAAFPW
ncbi:MAG: hypothetical protein WD768_11275 [Phycisphaeraceae bacterium]